METRTREYKKERDVKKHIEFRRGELNLIAKSSRAQQKREEHGHWIVIKESRAHVFVPDGKKESDVIERHLENFNENRKLKSKFHRGCVK